MPLTPERVREVVLMFAPIVVGILLCVWGFLIDSIAMIGFGVGLLGVPGLTESVRGVTSATAPKPRN